MADAIGLTDAVGFGADLIKNKMLINGFKNAASSAAAPASAPASASSPVVGGFFTGLGTNLASLMVPVAAILPAIMAENADNAYIAEENARMTAFSSGTRY